MKAKINKLLRKILFLLIYSAVLSVIGYVFAIFLSHRMDDPFSDIISMIGIFLVIIGVLLSLKGNPMGLHLHVGSEDSQNMLTYLDMETIRKEREITEYNKNLFKQSIVEFNLYNLVFVFGGIVLCLISLL